MGESLRTRRKKDKDGKVIALDVKRRKILFSNTPGNEIKVEVRMLT
jgi:hypothetical protein